MDYPIIFDGRTVGRLSVTQSGLMTVFEARCEDPGDLVRLSVYGESEGYLGVMVPRDGSLYLKKSLSRASMRGFPKQITHAGRAGERVTQPVTEQNVENKRKAEPKLEPKAVTYPQSENKPETVTEAARKTAAEPAAETGTEVKKPSAGQKPAPAPEQREARPSSAANSPRTHEPGTDLIWYRTPDGTLFTTWQGRSFMAVPESIHGLPMEKCLEHRPIEGQIYAVFETKNGKII